MFREGSFNRKEWQKFKYKDTPLIYLSPEEYKEEVSNIVGILKAAILQGQHDYQIQGNTYGLLGVALYGSFYQGNVHHLSDIDSCEIVNNEYAFDNEFEERLANLGLTRFYHAQTAINLDTGEGDPFFLRHGYQIITPFRYVRDQAEVLIPHLERIQKRNLSEKQNHLIFIKETLFRTSSSE